MATDLFLIRHGQSYANVSPVIGGMTGDAGLTDLGVRQADRLAARLVEEGFTADVLYSSTLPRARQTAEPVAAALGLPVSYDDELQEVRPGEADGLTVSEWQRRWPTPEADFLHPFDPFATGGESWVSFIARASTALVQLLARHPGQRVVAVTHGGVVSASVHLAMGVSGAVPFASFAPANTSITHWRHDPGGRYPPLTLVTLGDAAHLRGLDPGGR